MKKIPYLFFCMAAVGTIFADVKKSAQEELNEILERKKNFNALIDAIYSGNLALVKEKASQGYTINQHDSSMRTAFHHASIKNDPAIMKELLTSITGSTLLYEPKKGSFEKSKISLLEFPDSVGKTALMYVKLHAESKDPSEKARAKDIITQLEATGVKH